MRRIKLQEPTYNQEEIKSILDILTSEMVVMGKKTIEFQNKWSNWLGVKYSTFVNSGSSANLLLINLLTSKRAKYKFKPEDEILIPAVTWSTTLYPIIQLGLKPILVDVDPFTFNISLESCEKAISSKTKAIFAVHLLGNPIDMDKLSEFCEVNKLLLLEDCCEATGSKWNDRKVGTFGLSSSFSFMFAHHMSTIEGGMVCCNNLDDDRVIKSSRAHGWIRELDDLFKEEIINEENLDYQKFLFWDMGYNVRPTEISAVMGEHQLNKINRFIEIRKTNYSYYKKLFNDLSDFISIQQVCKEEIADASFFALGFIIKKDQKHIRRKLMNYLDANGIESRPLVAGNLARHPFYKLYCDKPRVPLTNSDLIHERGMYIPNHQNISIDDINYIVDVMKRFFNNEKI